MADGDALKVFEEADPAALGRLPPPTVVSSDESCSAPVSPCSSAQLLLSQLARVRESVSFDLVARYIVLLAGSAEGQQQSPCLVGDVASIGEVEQRSVFLRETVKKGGSLIMQSYVLQNDFQFWGLIILTL